jgi:hypothetical protein
MLRGRRSWLFDLAIVFLFAALLIRPWWQAKYVDNWGSIESTFIADARILKDHWPRPLWQPYWYLGTRFDYVYPPALRYGTAALAKYYPMETARAYHLYTAFFYCFGIAAVYYLARIGFRTRTAAYASAFLAAVVSPGYLFLPEVREDGFRFGTSKLNALVRYGEGPHMTALAWIPFALGFAWMALRKRSYPMAIASGACCAMVVSNNFYGATALAMFFPMLLWAIWVTERDWRLIRQAIVIPLVAYGLTAFWLTPSYLEITLRNMQYVSSKGNLWSSTVALIAVIAFAALTDRRYRNQTDRAWELFVIGSSIFFTLNTAGNRWFNFRIIGEPARLVPEVDILLNFLLVLTGIWLWRRGFVAKGIVLASALGLIGLHYNYLRHHRAIFPPPTDYKPSIYYKVPAWIAAHYPNARSYVTGAVRFWFNTWHDLYQLGGSSEQGLENQVVMPAQWEIVLGEDGERGMRWMQLLGVDLVAVHGPKSKEWYKDFQYPTKFDGRMPVVFDDGEDNRIFEIPRKYRSMARVVDVTALESLPKLVDQADLVGLTAMAKVFEEGPEAPTSTQWRGTDELLVKAPVKPGQTLIVQVTHDVNWEARSAAGSLPIQLYEPLGFMRIDVPPGVDEIRLVFRKPLEKTVGEVLFFITVAAIGYTLWRHRANTAPLQQA